MNDDDPAVTGVVIGEPHSRQPLVVIDRSDFAVRGGLYNTDERAAPAERSMREVWQVVLMQAPFYASPRHWQFSRDGLRFTAQMLDLNFLQAIADGNMPISLQEGVVMEVVVEWRERQVGQVWEYVKESRRITRVLSPQPTRSP